VKITLEIHDDVILAIEKIRNCADDSIALYIPEGSLVLENGVNLKLVKREAEKAGKIVEFFTEDEAGTNLINMLDARGEEFVAKKAHLQEPVTPETAKPANRKFSFAFPKVGLPIAITLAVLALVGAGLYFTLWQAPKASILIVVNSQPLTKSLEIKVKKDAKTDATVRVLAGKSIQAVVVDSQGADTTGEKLKGEKATGKVKIFNKTNTAVDLKKGAKLVHKETSTDLIFFLKDGVTVPANTCQEPCTPGSAWIPGETTAEVVAEDIGKDYNLKNDATLEVGDRKRSEVEAQADDDFEGGKSETIKIVTDEDKTKLSASVLAKITENAADALKSKLGADEELINGSFLVSITSEEFDAETDEEAETLKLTQTAAVTALTYSKAELNELLDSLVRSLVPEGFEQSDDERDVYVEVLGNSDSSTLSPDEADLQVTLKSFVVPQINESEVKKNLAGKSIAQAQKFLGGIRKVKTYKLDVSPGIPFFQRIPVNTEHITIEVNRE